MRRKLLLLWLLIPVPLLALHFSVGQRWLTRDHAVGIARKAAEELASGNATNSVALYEQAMALLDGETHIGLRAQLIVDSSRARVAAGDASEALTALDDLALSDEFDALPAELQAETRELSARTHYYAAWTMRLEGAERDEWMLEAESARRSYRHLAESEGDAGKASDHAANLEAVVELERMTMDELLARPLPKECKGMCNKKLSSKRKKCRKCQGKGKKPGSGKKKGKEDIRDRQKSTGAGFVEYQEGVGS